jgi:hypothetical protein
MQTVTYALIGEGSLPRTQTPLSSKAWSRQRALSTDDHLQE